MTTSNYSVLKSEAEILLNSSTLPSDIVTGILENLNQHVKVVKFDPSTSLATPTGAKVHGKDLVLIDPNGSVDLSSISKANIKGIDAFIFTTDEDVNFTLSGSNTLGFKGVVATNAGDDSVILNSENSVTVSSGAGDDSVKLGAGDDSVDTGAGNDSVLAGAGNDSVSAGSGDDIINTGAGNDSVLAGVGNDSISTSAGNDTVSAGSGDDIINTGVGNDSVSTGLGNDSVNLGFGNDIVFVSSGNTVVDLGAGNDIAKLDFGFTGVAQFNGNGGSDDKLDLSLVVIDTVERSGEMLTITLDDGSVIEASNFEKFVYDNPSDNVEDIVIVGAHQLDDDF